MHAGSELPNILPKSLHMRKCHHQKPPFMQLQCFFALTLNASWHSHVGSLFTKEQLKKVGSWCNVHFCHTSPSAMSMSKFGSKWQHLQPCFPNFPTSISSRLDHKLTEKLLWEFFVFFKIQFLSVGPISRLLPMGVPFNLLWDCLGYRVMPCHFSHLCPKWIFLHYWVFQTDKSLRQSTYWYQNKR